MSEEYVRPNPKFAAQNISVCMFAYTVCVCLGASGCVMFCKLD